MLYLSQDGLGMPDRDYYLKDGPEQRRVRAAYLKHVEAILRLSGKNAGEAHSAVPAVMRIETELARLSMTKEDRRDAEKTYHKMSLAKLSRLAPVVDWKRYFVLQAIPLPKEVIVMQPKFLKGIDRLLSRVSLDDWKKYLSWHLANDLAGSLSPAFVKQCFSFYGTTLMGAKKMKPLWRRALGSVNGYLGELLGQIYVKEHFTESMKEQVNEIVDDLFAAYKKRIRGLDWMSPATRKKALAKLRAMNRKLGYPDKWKSYRGLVLRPDDYFGNLLRVNEYEHRRVIRKLRGPVDRQEWFMSPQMVNAYFAPNLNDIVFPAAIMQFPFFDPDADDAMNYGALGMTIGHEITHGFDDQGAKFDSKGNMKNWWTKADKRRFEAKGKLIEKQFDAYQVAPGINVNGKLTLGENIADLGGLWIALDAYRLKLKRTGRKDIDGLTPEQRFFLGYAQGEAAIERPEFTKLRVLNDPHAPSNYRVNGPLSNMPEFYEAFNVKKGDKLYRPPASRAKIW
jgi:putative endopeptidase